MAVEILTYLPRIEAGQEKSLRSTLATFERGTSPFSEVPGTHVARFAVINWLGTGDPTNRRRLRPARLLFSAVVDGPEEAWLFGLFYEEQGRAIETVLQHCTGWPVGQHLAWTPWLQQYRVDPTHRVIAHDATVAQIHRGLRLQQAMAELRDKKDVLTPTELRAAYQQAMGVVGR